MGSTNIKLSSWKKNGVHSTPRTTKFGSPFMVSRSDFRSITTENRHNEMPGVRAGVSEHMEKTSPLVRNTQSPTLSVPKVLEAATLPIPPEEDVVRDVGVILQKGVHASEETDILDPSLNILLIKNQASLKNIATRLILEFVGQLPVPKNIISEYVHEISVNYRPNPFHNFHHAVSVTHFMAVILRFTNAVRLFPPLKVFGFILSALVHDVDHPGRTNLFEINSGSELSILYNDISVLENHHSSVAFRLMQKAGANILSQFSLEDRKDIRNTMITCILSTDMSKHSALIEEAKTIPSTLNCPIKSSSEQLFLGKLLLHAADLSGPGKVFSVAREWASRVTAEFNAQVRLETELGLPILSYMAATDEHSFLKNEIVFSGFFVAPLWRVVSTLFPSLQFVKDQLDDNISEYKIILKALEKEEYDSKVHG